MSVIIGFDLDNTLVNLNRPVKDIFKKYDLKYEPSIDWTFSNYPECIKNEIFEMFKNPEVMCNLKPFKGVVKIIDELKNADFELFIITSRHEGIKKETIKWVENLFDIPCYVVGFGKSKIPILKKLKIDIWVDDSPNELIEIQNQGISCAMISNKYTRCNYHLRKRVYHVKHIRDLFV